jgi:hypothetical protein
MISDVVFERLCAEDVFPAAPVRKRQNRSAIPELIRDSVRTVRMSKSTEVAREGIMTHSSGLTACELPAFISWETLRE